MHCKGGHGWGEDKLQVDEQQVVRSLTELLAIARVAMPDYLYAEDPRVQRARQLIGTLSQVSVGRPPTIIPAPTSVPDLTTPQTLVEVEQMPGAEPPWDITASLDAFMESDLAPATRTDSVVLILRDWLIGHGYMNPAPEHDN